MPHPPSDAEGVLPSPWGPGAGGWPRQRLETGGHPTRRLSSGLGGCGGGAGLHRGWTCGLCFFSRLHTGWSVHTYQTEKQRKSQSLSPAEVEAILQVIQRAERLDILEQQRVG